MTIDVSRHRCLILGTDGLWNMIPPQRAVEVVQHIDRQNKTQPNPDQQPLVRSKFHKTELHNANTFFFTIIALDESIQAIGQHSTRLLDDEQTTRRQLYGSDSITRSAWSTSHWPPHACA